MGDILIGMSGFSFDDRVGAIYTAGIRKQEMLPYYEKMFGLKALEVNYSYYSMPSGKTMDSLTMRTSQGFICVVRTQRGMAHR